MMEILSDEMRQVQIALVSLVEKWKETFNILQKFALIFHLLKNASKPVRLFRKTFWKD